MKEILEVFRAEEISIETRVRLIKKMGVALDDSMGMNWTGDVVKELVDILESRKNNGGQG